VQEFTPYHRGGSGSPLVLLHGFLDSWRTWELVLPALERQHDVLALTLPGHAGGAPFADELVDDLERALDEAGVELAKVAGNSLGGYLALQLGTRGRATSVIAFAPAGGWADDDPVIAEMLERQREVHRMARAAAPFAHVIAATSPGRRRVTGLLAEHYEHLPPRLVAHLLRSAARCDAERMLDTAAVADWSLDAERLTCPLRIVWGAADRVLPWPRAAARYRQTLPHADWVLLDGVAHVPHLDVPVEAAQLILDFP
jgi:pimeloyl-ACP methyl ester carboxylesterase